MSDEKKRLADALEAMASGRHHDEHEPEPDAYSLPLTPGDSSPASEEPPADRAVARPEVPLPPAGETGVGEASAGRSRSRPATPVAAKSVALSADAATGTPSPRPASPASPGTTTRSNPQVRPATPARPTSPMPPASSEGPISPANGPGETAYVSGSSPPAAVSARRRRPAHQPVFATLAFKRTLIPVCLVLGVGMPLLAVLWFTLDQDHPARKVSVALPLVFLFVGLGVLLLGILTMFQVREELQVRGPGSRRV